MKTAISVPTNLFEAAEQVARRLGLTRSKLYTMALSDYIAEHKTEGVTEKLNRIYGTHKATLDPQLSRLQTRSIARGTW